MGELTCGCSIDDYGMGHALDCPSRVPPGTLVPTLALEEWRLTSIGAAVLLEQAADTIQLERGEPTNGTRKLRLQATKLRESVERCSKV